MVTSKRTEGSADHLSVPLLVFKRSDKSCRVVVRGLLSTYFTIISSTGFMSIFINIFSTEISFTFV